ncbi:DUF1980 domain-containing protein [Cohnella cholangitidis]|uniref:DUF1980 domain-containing protein n=1 Tax=Cohnella cholangitidis TaxID=2598458 RepID=A0A7G5BVD8_9BACL|nr:DUF1980 domain-containing protein [Cohnella cholangitidis]QMV40922.1 DUF1980 domain-containing protein [Cohnella cholangitidis]
MNNHNHDHNNHHNHSHDHNSVSTSVHYLARALLLAGFAFFIVYLVRTGHLDLYIAKRMQFIVKLSALGLYAVAAQQLYAAIRGWFEKKADMPSCDCNHEMPSTWGKSLLLYGWFAFPLLIGFTLPDGMLGSSMAAVKGVQFAPQSIASSSYKPAPASPAVPTNEPVATDEALSKVPEKIPALDEPRPMLRRRLWRNPRSKLRMNSWKATLNSVKNSSGKTS